MAEKLSLLRPYSQVFDAWLASDQTDESRLLRGQALRDALSWSHGKRLSDEDYQFLAASQELDKREVQQALEAERAKVAETRLVQQKKNAQRQTILLIIISTAFLVTTVLGIIAFRQYRQAVLNEIKAITISSQALFFSHQRLDALKEAMRAWRKQKQLAKIDSLTQKQVEETLRQAVYGVTQLNRLSEHTAAIWRVKFSPNGERIASVSRDGTLKIWQLDGALLADFSEEHQGWILDVAFSPHAELLVTVGNDRQIILWQIAPDTQIPRVVQVLPAQSSEVLGVAFSPDGTLLATSENNGTLKLWRVGAGTQPSLELWQTLSASSSWIWTVKFSPDSQLLASVGAGKEVKLWRVNQQAEGENPLELVQTLVDHEKDIYSVDFSPDDQVLLSAGLDQRVILWKLDQVVELERVLEYGCQWLRDYLRTNSEIEESERLLCQ